MLSWSRDRLFPRRPRDAIQTFGRYFSTFQFEFALGYAPFYHTWLARVVSVPCQIDFGPTSYVYRVVLFSLKGDTEKKSAQCGMHLIPACEGRCCAPRSLRRHIVRQDNMGWFGDDLALWGSESARGSTEETKKDANRCAFDSLLSNLTDRSSIRSAAAQRRGRHCRSPTQSGYMKVSCTSDTNARGHG